MKYERILRCHFGSYIILSCVFVTKDAGLDW
jgi:hypothetical protein